MSGWKMQLGLGIIAIIAGFLILMNPFASSLAVEQVAGWLFMILGILQVVEGFFAEGWGGKLWSILLGIVAVFVGFNLVMNPLAGLLALTIVLGILFLVSGVFKLIVGFRIRATNLKWLVILSGVASLILAFIVLFNIPSAAAVTLGVMLGIEMLSNGVAAIMLALSRKSGGTVSAS